MKERSPLQGVNLHRNPKNGFVIFTLHYSADPEKRDSPEMAAIKASMPIAQFKQEFEIEWDSFSGMPVYQDFNASKHLAQKKPEPWAGLPILRGWDFGLTPACVLAQMQDQTLVILREYTAVNQGAEQFCNSILPQMNALYPGVRWMDFADPAGNAKAQSDETTCYQVLCTFGLTPIPGPVAWEERRQSVEHFLTRQSKSAQCFQIWEADCPMLVRGFRGGYRYPEKAKEIEPEKLRPLKDAHSHPHDALQYIASCLRRGGLSNRSASIPSLSYFKRGTA